MTIIQKFHILFLTVAFCLSCSSQKSLTSIDDVSMTPEKLGRHIDKILSDSLLDQSNVGIKVISLESGNTLYAKNEGRLFHPASNMKLLTTALALKRLGPNFRFKTDLVTAADVALTENMSADIYLRGFGDADLLTEDLQEMVDAVVAKGIRQIDGNLVCDDSYMDDLFWGKGWMWDDASAWYWAPISALSVNDNCVTVTIKPGARKGAALQVAMEPATSYMKIINNGRTVGRYDSLARDSFKVLRRWKKPENIIDIEGGMWSGSREREYIIDVIDAPLYVGTLMKELLVESGVKLNGEVILGQAPDSSKALAVHHSEPMSASVNNTNKESDNLSAELLLKAVAAEYREQPASAADGISELYKLYDEWGVDSTSYYLADGSGVSRYNVITPDMLCILLREMHSDFKIQAEFKASLPIAGVDGTLEDRMKGTPAEGKLRAKTGSLRGVSTLSGYTTGFNGEELAFAIMIEHFVGSTSKIRKVQDKIGALLSIYGAGNVLSVNSSE